MAARSVGRCVERWRIKNPQVADWNKPEKKDGENQTNETDQSSPPTVLTLGFSNIIVVETFGQVTWTQARFPLRGS